MKCIILAGGFGERLWPLSRELYPKSLLNLFGGKTLIQNIYELALEITQPRNIFTITNIRQLSDTQLQLKEITKNPQIISEPMSRNTAPAIASMLTFLKDKKDEIIIILPVDFSVEDINEFKTAIEKAKQLAKKGYIAALGVKPSYFEDEFGYIESGNTIKPDGYEVVSFKEKPDADFWENKNKDNLYWNCGIYISKISILLEELNKYSNNAYSNFSKNMFDENCKIKYEYYENIPEISIDYQVIEHTKKLALVELKTKWQDYGSWTAIYNNSQKDNDGNVLTGNVITEKVKNSLVYSSKELTAVNYIEDKVIIETEDAVIVCDKTRTKDIKNVVKKLKETNENTVISPKTVFRPWGFYTCLNKGNGWLTKIITVSPGHKLSLQSHNYRSEHWVVLEGEAVIILEDNKYNLNKCESIDIPLKAKHSLQNHSTSPLKILEVQKGEYIGEDDIIRYEDMYGRVK
ncbi:MAG: mannose-1-phosphate guanylyltransferase/mannose-6-phosphate isomerase [Candidatus Gastranaerophilales bacterium]|nr:mannose-1-phosphate guanylyltransferase/mannose-6-phosphate isomerase [Candidatus Gastranaerophilales bacterium]